MKKSPDIDEKINDVSLNNLNVDFYYVSMLTFTRGVAQRCQCGTFPALHFTTCPGATCSSLQSAIKRKQTANNLRPSLSICI